MQWGDDLPTVIDAFRAGNEAALADIYARWSPLVHTLALRLAPDVAAAEELTAQVFTEAWASRHELDPVRTSLPAWLVAITRDTVARTSGSPSTAAPSRTAVRASSRTRDELAPAVPAERLVCADQLSRLEAVPRRVLALALDDGLTHGQIGDRLGLPLGAVRHHLSRSLAVLRGRLEVQAHAH